MAVCGRTRASERRSQGLRARVGRGTAERALERLTGAMRSTEATALSGALEDESDVVVAYRLRFILDNTRDRMDQAGHYALSRVLRIGINSRWEPDGSV